MKLTPVKSSNIDAIGYEEAEMVLYVQFKGGGLYKYAKVPQSKFSAFMKAPSK